MGPVDGTVMWVTLRQLFGRKRLIVSIVFALLPGLIALVYSANHDGLPPVEFLAGLYRDIVVGTLLPLAAAVLGTTTFGGEIDDGTIVYLLVKPVPRWKVVLSKWLVAVLGTAAIVAVAILLPWLVVDPRGVPFSTPLAYLAGAAVSCVLYCALFVAIGLATRRALVVSLLYIVVLEETLSRNVAGLKSISVREFGIAVSNAVSSAAASLGGGATLVSMSTVWIMGTIILVGSLALASRRLGRYEMAEKL
jgi:ABC-2 type transport system permease protein